MIDSQIIKNIIEALVNKGINNATQLATVLSYDQGNMSKIVNGKLRIPASLREKLYQKYGILHSYTKTGEGHMFEDKNNDSNVLTKLNGSDRNNLTIVPLKAFAGFANGYENKAFMDSLEKRNYPEIQGECFAFEVEGFSMYDSKVIGGRIFQTGYKPGSFVYTTALESFDYLNKNRNYVFQTVDGIQLKQFVKIENGKCYLSSINDDYNPVTPIPLKQIKKVYLVERSDNKEN